MRVVIIGAGGHGKVVLDILRHDVDAQIAGFIDDDAALHNSVIEGVAVLGSISSLPNLISRHKLDAAIIAVGDNKVRARLHDKVKEAGLILKKAIHSNALIARDVEIREGVVIAAGVVISTGTRIGDNVIINTGAVIDHDNVIEEYVHISPGVTLAGKVKVGRYSHVGLGVTVVQDLTIGENATVGAGAVVLDHIPASATAVGVPARVIKIKENTEG